MTRLLLTIAFLTSVVSQGSPENTKRNYQVESQAAPCSKTLFTSMVEEMLRDLVVPPAAQLRSTNVGNGRITPFLSASAPYNLQPGLGVPVPQLGYENLFPEVFSVHNRQAFGGMASETVEKFWADARDGKIKEIEISFGEKVGNIFVTPFALYERKSPTHTEYVILQHGNMMVFDTTDQPYLTSGQITLYRGVTDAKEFKFPDFHSKDARLSHAFELWANYQLWISQDAGRAYSEPYRMVSRSFTDHIRRSGHLFRYLSEQKNLTYEDRKILMGFSNTMDKNLHFTTSRATASGKFGPNFVQLTTSINNVRITSVANTEHEVKVVDPRMLLVGSGNGAEIKLIPLEL